MVVTAEDDILMLEWKVNTILRVRPVGLSQLDWAWLPWRWKWCFYSLLLIQSHLLSPKCGGDKARYSPEVFEVVVWWKANFQGACHVDSSQTWEDYYEDKLAHVEPRGASEGKFKLLTNVTMLVLLYGAPIWADTINTKKYQKTEMIFVQRKAVLRCVSACCTVSIEKVCVLTCIPLIEIVADECKRVFTALHVGLVQWVEKYCR